ncbi:hypothetical protein PSEUBRA_004819 [Kalmanozyma brasiliensis GHG001]|uniref:uncharacterized protein n=1 Tax=Kalmanozyma brasiliensis (strain GHG001) TaxID=1365824 RepID=UPI002867F975|nr:uncharacterized protein PSEUBRA_004819 [Kalmanozyma brasiliensis GHG001]KAF6767434.1 hypothetical protein PSEUBRA_004819 [Kalmanozyma brasiliensis GHG001]
MSPTNAGSSAAAPVPASTKRRSSSSDAKPGPSSSSRRPPTCSATSARTSPVNTVTGFAAPPRPRPPTSPSKKARASAFPSSSRSPTPTSSAASSRRSSVVLDSSAYRYSLNVGSINRFPGGTSGGEMLRAAAAQSEAAIDPSRASISSDASSRLSSRYTAEEVAPQRRPVYLALPSDPSAVGVWSSTTLAPPSDSGDKKPATKGKKSEEGKRNSKVMTSFPFPHPATPRRRGGAGGDAPAGGTGGRGIGATWQRLLTAIFAGPYERQLNREEQEDDRITQSIIHDIARRNGGQVPLPSNYGTFPQAESDDPNDPYGYRQLAGSHLLPSYTSDLIARRRERRRARSRARFQCMASWTIWTVSVLLVVIVVVLVYSFVYPDRLDIPNHSDEGDEDAVMVLGLGSVVQWAIATGRNGAGR